MSDDEMLQHYSRALDEVYRLRALLALEAGIIAGHLDYATFPKTRRGIAQDQIDRMRRAACGDRKVIEEFPYWTRSHKHALREAGASETLTRSQWEQQA